LQASALAVRQLAAIVESSNDAIISENLDGEVLSWNRGAEKMYGYSAEEVIGRKITLIFPEGSEGELHDLLAQVRSGASIEEFETVRRRKDGTFLNVAITISPLRDSDGNVEGASVIARDITNRKEIEKRISEFYSTVSHELRTPLTSIRGALGLIDDDIIEHGSTESREMIRIARTSSERLVRLINDILDLKKIESGKLELIKEEITASALLSKGIDAMEGMAREAKVEISHSVDPGIMLEADADRLTQVLTNLISNAVKYSEPGSLVMITVEPSDDNKVRFSVTDEGPGIAVEHQGKLFGKFQQIDSSDVSQTALDQGRVQGQACFLPSPLPHSVRKLSSGRDSHGRYSA
jgi:PAS domain S-box-containing protein